MAINQTELFDKLEKLTQNKDYDNFIFEFLHLYDFPKSTITRLKKTVSGDNDNINVALAPLEGEVANQKGIYFKPIKDGAKLLDTLDTLKKNSIIQSKNIAFIIITDYQDILAYDVENDEMIDCPFTELHKEYGFFLPLAGYEKGAEYTDNPADVKAAERLSRLFDLIRYKNNLTTDQEIHALNVFLTRLLFCFFAEDTDIFKKNQFSDTVAKYTKTDGSDLKPFLKSLFSILNSEPTSDLRQSSPSHLTDFPYVNGKLFEDEETIPKFDARTRRMLLECSSLNWSEINPDIFGSMFQAVIHENQRRRLGQHYTSVPNIMKVLRPLFLDELEEEFIKSRHSEKKLKELLLRLGNIRVFDPACGSGNFLIIAFKELRKLEIRIYQALSDLNEDPEMMMSNIRLNHFYGIEIDDFAHEIALLSLWLAEHQMNYEFNRTLKSYIPTLPLHESGNVIQGNSLRTDWVGFCPANKGEEVYVVGNPPFGGVNSRSEEQSEDMEIVFKGFKTFKSLDYVTSWFWLGAQYIQKTNAKMALVATNSICQGIQVAPLWEPIFDLGLEIDFAYQSFLWANNAKDKASVYVVIIGLSFKKDTFIKKNKFIYREINKNWHQISVSNISPYLTEGNNIAIKNRSNPINKVNLAICGSIPVDNGELLLSVDEKNNLLSEIPSLEQYIFQIVGAQEYLNNIQRWCLWFHTNPPPIHLFNHPLLEKKFREIQSYRALSTKKSTRKLANIPHLFGEIRTPKAENYILIPRTTSEKRKYIPIGFMNSNIITTNANLFVDNGTLYDFGILTSIIHNDWMRLIAGRLKSDYRYSANIVYNTFPWPQNIGPQRREQIEKLAKEILRARARYPDKTLAELYDPDKMPADLLKAHETLDRAVEKLYRDAPFRDSTERVEYLFKLYEKLINEEKNKKKKK
ncbi:putative DNA methyltransferase YeeA [Ignatzschineria indica]|uniref:site-specific DNA-methyltransferase (adenine-specific) n=1 Tax=Ignatzschineria indica TaxID=472583 RepID=A0A2U2AM06_9GAMM|nr:DNA methyltransferase [Ignatzschineria indica]PWD84241.1 class I SAM-dependent DNA methyltransferase [Ignatzschineria indica]GGZ74979.1 putative DNA methyltransferase YeeA [Ignatzschineria indica]